MESINGRSVPLVSPIHLTSVYRIADLDCIDAINANDGEGYVYARDGHPNATELATSLRTLHNSNWGVVTATGMAAISTAILALLSQGDRIVASHQIYGKTKKLFRNELSRFGITTSWVDTNDLDAVRRELSQSPTKLVFVETIANPLCRLANLKELANTAHEFGAMLFVDNTFASPVLCRPLDRGADLVMESLTKMIGGHSDVTMGFLAGSDPQQGEQIASSTSTWGLTSSPFDCWLVSRGLATLELRMQAATRSAMSVAQWLERQPNVKRVIYPNSPSHPDHHLARSFYPDGAGNMLCFELPDREAVNLWMRSSPEIPFCPSLGHHTTTCSHPDTTSHRFESDADKRLLGITPGLVRLSIGCEPVVQILSALERGLRAIS